MNESPKVTTIYTWLVLSDEQMSKRWPVSLLNDEQMSNWVGVKHLPDTFIYIYILLLLLLLFNIYCILHYIYIHRSGIVPIQSLLLGFFLRIGQE